MSCTHTRHMQFPAQENQKHKSIYYCCMKCPMMKQHNHHNTQFLCVGKRRGSYIVSQIEQLDLFQKGMCIVFQLLYITLSQVCVSDNTGLVLLIPLGWEIHLSHITCTMCTRCLLCHPYIPHSTFSILHFYL